MQTCLCVWIKSIYFNISSTAILQWTEITSWQNINISHAFNSNPQETKQEYKKTKSKEEINREATNRMHI